MLLLVHTENFVLSIRSKLLPGLVAQSVTCLTSDTCLTADPGVESLILAGSHRSESMCINYWLTAQSSLPRKKGVDR